MVDLADATGQPLQDVQVRRLEGTEEYGGKGKHIEEQKHTTARIGM